MTLPLRKKKKMRKSCPKVAMASSLEVVLLTRPESVGTAATTCLHRNGPLKDLMAHNSI